MTGYSPVYNRLQPDEPGAAAPDLQPIEPLVRMLANASGSSGPPRWPERRWASAWAGLPVAASLKAWWGTRGAVTPLHYDSQHNVYAQLHGALVAAHAVHAPCMCHACAMHVPSMCHACAMHTPRTSRFDTRPVCTPPLPPRAGRPSPSSRPHGSRRDSTSTRTPTRSRTSHVYLTPPPGPPPAPPPPTPPTVGRRARLRCVRRCGRVTCCTCRRSGPTTRRASGSASQPTCGWVARRCCATAPSSRRGIHAVWRGLHAGCMPHVSNAHVHAHVHVMHMYMSHANMSCAFACACTSCMHMSMSMSMCWRLPPSSHVLRGCEPTSPGASAF